MGSESAAYRSFKELQAEIQASGEQFVVDDLDTLKAVADPLRLRILLAMQDEGPVTVKEVATRLGVPQTRLYYHVKLLEKHGLIHVVGRRMVSGIEERSYQTTTPNWTVAPRLASMIAETGLLSAMMDVVGAELAVALADESKEIGDPEGPVPALTYTRWFLTPQEVEEIQARWFLMMEDFASQTHGADPGPGRSEYNAFFVLHRRGGRAPDDRGTDAL